MMTKTNLYHMIILLVFVYFSFSDENKELRYYQGILFHYGPILLSHDAIVS